MVCTKSMFVIVQYRVLGSFCILTALAAQRYSIVCSKMLCMCILWDCLCTGRWTSFPGSNVLCSHLPHVEIFPLLHSGPPRIWRKSICTRSENLSANCQKICQQVYQVADKKVVFFTVKDKLSTNSKFVHKCSKNLSTQSISHNHVRLGCTWSKLMATKWSLSNPDNDIDNFHDQDNDQNSDLDQDTDHEYWL